MSSLDYYFKRAVKEKWAIPQFNFSNLETLKAIIGAAKDLRSPVIIGTSEGESRFLGMEQAVSLVRNFRDQFNLSLFLNLDHGKSFDYCKLAVDKGYDTCHFDGSGQEFNENIAITKKVVKYAKSKKIPVEGEIEGIGSDTLTDPEKAAFFCRETGVERLAINIGTSHGGEGQIQLSHLAKIKEKVGSLPLVLHGASGVSDEEVKGAIKSGIAKINVNTALRKAFKDGLKEVFGEKEEEIVPYKYMSKVVERIKGVVEEKIKLFGSFDRM